jgi:biopolymer transport protein ExbB
MTLIPFNNLILYIIGLISVAGIMIFVERLLVIKKGEIDIQKLLLSLRSAIENGNMVEALQACDEQKGPISSIIKVGLGKHSRSKAEIESAMEIQGLIEIAHLEKNAKILSLIATIAPLIGLLGTVLGFIQAFSEMRLSGLVDISATRIGEAMEFALVTTAAGLVVAIPAIVGYNYIVSLIEEYLLEMQTTTREVVDLLVFRDEF